MGDSHAPFILEHARFLAKQGIQVQVIAMHSPGASTHEEIEGVQVFRPRYLPERYEILRKESAGLPALWRKNPLLRLAILPFLVVQAITLIIHSRDCDLIHAQWTLSGMIAWCTQFLHQKPYVVTVHGSDIFQAARTPWIRFLTRVALNHAGEVIAVSRALANAAAELGVDVQKIRVIPDGVDTKRFYPSIEGREPFLLFVGSLTEQKGVRYLLQAFRQVISVIPDMKLTLVGDGSMRTEFETLASNLGIAQQTSFLGSRSQEEVSQLMRKASVFVLPSIKEGLGVVVLEAMASGTPCIGTHSGGIPELITEKEGILVEPGNSVALADALLKILSDATRCEQMGIYARQKIIEQFDWHVIALKNIKVYESILNRAS